MKVGQLVHPTVDKAAYYSGYANNPIVMLTQDMIGIVMAVDVAAVHKMPGKPMTFACVDFIIPGVFPFGLDKNEPIWRGAFYDDEIKATEDLIPEADIDALLPYAHRYSTGQILEHLTPTSNQVVRALAAFAPAMRVHLPPWAKRGLKGTGGDTFSVSKHVRDTEVILYSRKGTVISRERIKPDGTFA
jgi:hypothetical protein